MKPFPTNVSLEHRLQMLAHAQAQERKMTHSIDIGHLHRIADRISDRLLAMRKQERIERINLDVIRTACEVAAHFECFGGAELATLEHRVTRRVVEKVG